jgi:hypothetical protein
MKKVISNLKSFKKEGKELHLKLHFFTTSCIIQYRFSTDEEKMGKSGRVRYKRIGASETPSESGRMAAKRP